CADKIGAPMWTAIVTVGLTFVLTGLLGNWFIQRWQHRNWVAQQQFLGEEKEYLALKQLWEELARLSGTRLSRMRRLVLVLRSRDDEIVKSRLADYDA